ncbi:hypothetical protein BK140_16785 [Paenibacillus macerans]|nr:hypothetical protein BK140_16785 [Paenibacillus macerans]
MRQLSHEECMSLLDSIRKSQPGDWTHDFHTIASGPAQYPARIGIGSRCLGHVGCLHSGPSMSN